MFGPILPHSTATYTILRKLHTILAYLFFFTILMHLGGVLFHAIVVRDGVLKPMVPWRANELGS